MRKKKRARCYFGLMVLFTLLGYYKYQSKTLSDPLILNETQTQPSRSTTRVIDSVIHRGTDTKVHSTTQPTVATVSKIKATMTRDKENLSVSLLQYVSNVSLGLLFIAKDVIG